MIMMMAMPTNFTYLNRHLFVFRDYVNMNIVLYKLHLSQKHYLCVGVLNDLIIQSVLQNLKSEFSSR